MRIVLFAGKGGVGKTTIAAATALRASDRGTKTLLISTDPAHSLGDALGVQIGSEAAHLEAGLTAVQVDVRQRLERSWGQVSQWLGQVVEATGVDPVEAGELTGLPGADEILGLLEMHRLIAEADQDLVVVDCAPTAETLRLLALPDVFDWWLRRIFPTEARISWLLGTKSSRLPMPPDAVLTALDRLRDELNQVRALLTDSAQASVRLVLTPESVVVAEARRQFTALSLHGYAVDGVIANRVFHADGDPWRDRWAAAHAAAVQSLRHDVAPVPVQVASFQPVEPVGSAALASVAQELYGSAEPTSLVVASRPLFVERRGQLYVLSLALPLADRDDLTLARAGDDLVVTVGASRRSVHLPSALRRCVVLEAKYVDGRLECFFEPDPTLWGSR